jgi:hypothetical protein
MRNHSETRELLKESDGMGSQRYVWKGLEILNDCLTSWTGFLG